MLRIVCLLATVLAASAAQASPPQVIISYNPAMDSVCAWLKGSAIKDSWKAELSSRQAEFEQLWISSGPKMMDAVESITGKTFSSRSATVRLTLCDIPSESFIGIVINMRYALQSFTPKPVPMRYKVNTLFHELLHTFLVDHPVANSELLKDFSTEPERVRNHLHLFALEKAVFLQLDEHQALQELVAIDSQLPGGFYKRAWEIVNASDSEYLKYIAEVSR
jgi:hypothetical protein